MLEDPSDSESEEEEDLFGPSEDEGCDADEGSDGSDEEEEVILSDPMGDSDSDSDSGSDNEWKF